MIIIHSIPALPTFVMTEQDDVIITIMSFASVQTLDSNKSVCRLWRKLARQALALKVTCPQRAHFSTHFELYHAVRIYQCAIRYQASLADDLAARYGWPLNQWKVGRITNFSNLFRNLPHFNSDICLWDTSNATTMEGMFYGAKSFNRDISNWNISKVENMTNMFSYATNFSYKHEIDAKWDLLSSSKYDNATNNIRTKDNNTSELRVIQMPENNDTNGMPPGLLKYRLALNRLHQARRIHS
mmetsp:Transcript_11796/g.18164  ORF Transcript_11796/g.18164 Transcript_11796/m.18164 type:complete len:242 (-) Transcript_11796:271-996(-)